MAFEPVVAVKTDFAPVPRAELTFLTVPADTVTATVFRVVNGISSRVRGAINVFAAGGFAVVDTEIPFMVDVAYRAELFDADGLTLGFTDDTIVFCNLDITFMHNPLNVTVGVQVDPLPSFAADVGSPFEGELVQPSGGGTPVWVGFGRTGLRGVSLDVATDTDSQAADFRSLFGSESLQVPPILCVRTHPKWALPLPFFALVRSPREQRFNVEFGGEIRYWVLQADEVRPPAPALAGPTLTYLDMENTYADYEAAEAAYLTYLDAESDFSLAGFAL